MGANNDDFRGQIYYHGTPHVFNPGDELLPPATRGGSASADPTKVYASKDLYVAKFMAWEQNNYNGNNFDDEKFPEGTEPPEHVYRVTPIDPTEKLQPHSSLTHVPRPDLPWGSARARDVVSKVGFRVLSQVQNPDEVLSRMREIADKKARDLNRRLVDVGKSRREGKLAPPPKGVDEMYRDAAVKRATKKKANKDLVNAMRKSRKFSAGNVSRAE